MGEFVMHRLFPIVCNMSLTASVVILAVLAVRRQARLHGAGDSKGRESSRQAD